jgi:membrane-bound lytic murein transglycosylase D
MIISRRKVLTTVIILLTSISAILLISSGFGREYGKSKVSALGSVNIITVFPIPDSVRFAGEKMPLENFDTRESLEREVIITAYRHSSTILIIKYLAVAESDLSNLISPVGATGFWQIMPETGKEEGMEINTEVDERYSIEKSTRFACEYFLKSYARYGNWTLAAASYNGGRNGLDDQIEIQHETNYYNLLLNEETSRYIFRAVAYKLIINNPSAYGFEIDKKELYPEIRYIEVKVDTAVTDITGFAKKFGTNYKLLKLLNPWLRKPFLTNKAGKTYSIKIPAEGSRVSD